MKTNKLLFTLLRLNITFYQIFYQTKWTTVTQCQEIVRHINGHTILLTWNENNIFKNILIWSRGMRNNVSFSSYHIHINTFQANYKCSYETKYLINDLTLHSEYINACYTIKHWMKDKCDANYYFLIPSTTSTTKSFSISVKVVFSSE